MGHDHQVQPQSLWCSGEKCVLREETIHCDWWLHGVDDVAILVGKMLPFNLKSGGEVPGPKPPFHLCHGLVQVVPLIGPNCVLKIGFGRSKPGKISEEKPMT